MGVYARRPGRQGGFPAVLTTGPEGVLCSGRVGSTGPIRGGPAAAGYVGLPETHVSGGGTPAWEPDFPVSAVSCS
jgi:hypothetical protein